MKRGTKSNSLFSQIGESTVRSVVRSFYARAFQDGIIGHFFFHSEESELVAKQFIFAAKMLGAKGFEYNGPSLKNAHSKFSIRNVHFNRRQKIMRDVLESFEIESEIVSEWLGLEEALRPLVVNS